MYLFQIQRIAKKEIPIPIPNPAVVAEEGGAAEGPSRTKNFNYKINQSVKSTTPNM